MATENYDMYMPNYSNYADIKALVNNFNIIDNGLALNVGNSTGTGNNYILDIGTITLTSANKGIRFMFFADKDSDTTNTVKIVINNKTYILLDMNKKNVRKIKKGVPITIAYAGDDTNFFLASGGEVTDYESTSVATDGSNVLAPNTFVGTDGEIHTGTMPNNGTKTKQLAINETYTLGKGYYDSITVNQSIATKGSQIYIPSRNDQVIYANQYLNGNQTIKGDYNLLAENIKEGVSLFGTLGTCNIQSMGGSTFVSGTGSVTLTEKQSRILVDFSAKVPSTVRVIWGKFTSGSSFYFVNFRSETSGTFKPIVWDKYYSKYADENPVAITGINLGDGDSSHTWSAGTYTYTWYAI
ncbi:hypothetical protein AB2T90_19585 [Clostridium butyricum]|uniref:hypothetical protein n=1 Tax=Clostridium butyricum TaxID=1492 RepID=UPI003465FDFC